MIFCINCLSLQKIIIKILSLYKKKKRKKHGQNLSYWFLGLEFLLLWYNYVSSTAISFSKINQNITENPVKSTWKSLLDIFFFYILAFKHFGFYIPNLWIISSKYSLVISSVSEMSFSQVSPIGENYAMNMINNFKSWHHWRPPRLYCIFGHKILESGTPFLHSWIWQAVGTWCLHQHLWISFGVFFCRNKIFMTAQSSALGNFTCSIYLVQTLSCNKFYDKHRDLANCHWTL